MTNRSIIPVDQFKIGNYFWKNPDRIGIEIIATVIIAYRVG